jgi:hypothetical protein
VISASALIRIEAAQAQELLSRTSVAASMWVPSRAVAERAMGELMLMPQHR